MKKLIIFIFAMILTQCKSTDTSVNRINSSPYGVCYSKIEPSDIQEYKLLILESDLYNRAEIMQLKAGGTKIFGYLSLGEVSPYKWYYPMLQKIGFLGENENWGSFYLDISNQKTKDILLKEVLPEIVAKGVDGVFLDTIDAVAPYTVRNEYQPDMLELIREIKKRHKNLNIIQNSGIFLLSETHTFIDAVLIEDVVSGYNFSQQKYSIRNEQVYTERLRSIEESWKKFNLPFFLLEFADTKTLRDSIRSVLNDERFPYFISTISLDTLPKIPDNYTNKF